MTQVVAVRWPGGAVEIVEGADGYHRIGSLTKPVTAAVVLALVDVDRSVESYLPGWGGPPQITVGMLLEHTSGLVNHPAEADFWAWAHERADVPFEPEELWRFALDRGLAFRPGTGQLYSSAGYVVLGRVVEAVTGRPAHVEIRERVLEPLGLCDTYLAPQESPPEPLVPGREGDLDMSALPQATLRSAGWTAGDLEAKAADAVRIIPGVARPEMLPTSADRRFGMGLATTTVAGHRAWSHTGRSPGYRAAAVHLPELDLSVAALAASGDARLGPVIDRVVRRLVP